MRKSGILFVVTAVQLFLLCLIALHAVKERGASQPGLREKQEMIRRLGLTDLCLVTEARYTRHPHQVVMWSDSQDESDWPPELAALLASRAVRRAERSRGQEDEEAIVCVASEEQAGWFFGHYEVRCRNCRKKHEIEEPETLWVFDVQPLSRKAVDLVLSRWGKLAPDDGLNHALRPPIDPYGPCMEGLLGFLKRHRAHRLEAALKPVGR